jgi:hypothetical protein
MLACMFDFFHDCMIAALLACLLPSLLAYTVYTCLQWDSPPDNIPTKAEALEYSSTEYSNQFNYWLPRLINWVDPLLLITYMLFTCSALNVVGLHLLSCMCRHYLPSQASGST